MECLAILLVIIGPMLMTSKSTIKIFGDVKFFIFISVACLMYILFPLFCLGLSAHIYQ